MSDLLDGERKARLDAENRAEQERLRALHAEKGRKPLLSIREARRNRTLDRVARGRSRAAAVRRVAARRGRRSRIFARTSTGRSSSTPGSSRAATRRSSTIRRRERRRATSSARRTSCSTRSAPAGSSQARGVYGFWPASRRGRRPRARRTASRVLDAPSASRPCRLASESLARRLRRARGLGPRGSHRRVRGRDPRGRDARGRFAADLDDYRAIMVRALADRLAEAFAERLHERARHEWYAPDGAALRRRANRASASAGSALHTAIPACPDHSEKGRSSRCSTSSVPGSG